MKFGDNRHRVPLPAGRPARVLPLWPDRWHVVLGDRQRPLWLPAGNDRFYRHCLRHFIADSCRTLYARTLLRVNRLVPQAGVVPELRLPRAMRRLLSFDLPITGAWSGAIRIGAAGPHQKAAVLLTTPEGQGQSLAKVAMVPDADARVLNEGHWLKQLAAIRPLAPHVPRLVGEGASLNGRRYLVTTLAPATRSVRGFAAEHVHFLAALGRARLEPSKFKLSPCERRLERVLGVLEPCLDPDARLILQRALRDCVRHLAGWHGPFVIAHGNFVPWKTRAEGHEVFVFDWARAYGGANPLSDLLNYQLMPSAMSGRGMSERAVIAALREAGRRAARIYPEWNWRHPVIPALTLAYLLDVVLHRCLVNQCVDHADPVVRGYWQLVERREAWWGG